MEDKDSKANARKHLAEELMKELDSSFVKRDRHTLYKSIMSDIEKPLIEKVLERTFGNQVKAAKLLGINRNTLRVKIKKLGINVEKWKF